jgi:hypothetical protein
MSLMRYLTHLTPHLTPPNTESLSILKHIYQSESDSSVSSVRYYER